METIIDLDKHPDDLKADDLIIAKYKMPIDLIRQWIHEGRTGKLVINFFKGGISSVNKEETIKLTTEK